MKQSIPVKFGLVKPVSIEELENAISRLVVKRQSQTRERLEVLNKYMDQRKSQDHKIALPLRDGFQFIKISMIVRIESNSSYCRLVMSDNQTILVTRLLKEFEELLTPYHFFRVHNEHLINLNYIKKYFRGMGGEILMDNGDVIPVSRRKKDEFIQILNL